MTCDICGGDLISGDRDYTFSITEGAETSKPISVCVCCQYEMASYFRQSETPDNISDMRDYVIAGLSRIAESVDIE